MKTNTIYSFGNTVKIFVLGAALLLGVCGPVFAQIQLQSAPQEQVIANEPSHLPAKILPAAARNNINGIGKANYAYFSKRVINKNDEVLGQNKGYEQHPELGVLPANAPCRDCYELIGSRTENGKTYAISGTNGKKVVIQNSNFPMHYRDEKGNLATIENELHPDIAHPKVFATKHQPVYIKIDADLGYSTISRDFEGNSISNNKNLELVYIKPDGREHSLGNANWSNYTAGDNGVIVKGAWPGIDIEMTVKPNGVETNFYINKPLPEYSDGKLVLRDHIQMSDGLSLYAPSHNDYTGDVKVINGGGEEFFNIGEAIAYEEHDAKSSLQTLNYTINDRNVLDINIPGSLLNRPSTSYPVVIDPAVTVTNVLAIGPRFSYYTNYCIGNNNVPIPAGYTITDIQTAYAYYSPTGAVPDFMYGIFNFRVGACTSPNPAIYAGYACMGATGPGIYCGGPMYPLDLLPDVAACVPAMSCVATTLDVQVGCTQYWALTANCSAAYFNTDNVFPYTVYVYANTGGITPIFGPTTVCVGSTITLTDASGGGVWSSGTPSVATIDPVIGKVTGISPGTTLITYTIGGCSVTMTVTVLASSPISGNLSVCQGSTTLLSDALTPGTWSSIATAIATVDPVSGLVGGVSPGTATISYVLTSTGCASTGVVTVTPMPTAILGNFSVCSGASTTLSDLVAGGVWSSSNPGVASIGAGTGVLSGLGAVTSTAIITYAISSCSVSATVTVNQSPAAITGTPNVCVGLTTNLTDAVAGGIWTSSNTGIATVSGTGVVTGAGVGGIATITYTMPGNCYVTAPVTVNPAPSAILGNPVVCQGLTTSLSDLVGGGAWSSSASGTASIDPVTGLVSALASGTAVITYTDANCTPVTTVVTVNPVAPINGTAVVCAGLTTSLSDALTGGTWASGATSIASVDGAGLVTAYVAGNATIVYTNTYNCAASVVVTVNTSPVAISGNFNLCVSVSNQLTDGTPGGAWSSSDPTIASITGTGLATGVATGTATITYTLPIGSCTATSNVTVNPVPGVINGTTGVCIGSSATLTDAAAGGTWSSSNIGVATIGSLSGIVSSASAGTTGITYTIVGSGCNASVVFTVNPAPAAISGTSPICQGASVAFSDASGGGTWSSSNPSVGSVDPTGMVTGVTPGTTTITYTLPTTCLRIYTTTISPAPTAINGSSSVCVDATTTLTDGIAGGAWSITAGTGTASIGAATGMVTGLTPGTVIVTYATCSPVSFNMLVNPLPTAILGEGSICQGTSTTVSDVSPGGSWSASAGGTISPTGVVTGLSAITGVTVTYTLPTSCYVTAPIAVSPAPGPILGLDTVCPSSSVILSDATPGGVWSSSDGTIAHAIAITGEIQGIVQGDVTISYTLVSGCYTVTPFHVDTPIPVFLSVSPSPADTFLCSSTPVTLTATVTPVVGIPSFDWELFGSYIGSGNPYTYNPTHGDFITCVMTVSGACVTPSVVSKDVTLNVWPQGGPVVVMTYTQPDTAAYMGEVYTFYTTVTFGGPSPTYQWYVNNVPVGGANGPVFTTHIYDENDSVYCVVNGNSPCDAGSYVGTSNSTIIYGQGWLSVGAVRGGRDDFSLFPNPNTGSFTLSGTMNATQDKEVSLEVTDMLGRTVYTGTTLPQNGTVRAEIKLGTEAAGSYLLRVNTETGTQAFHFVVQ